MSKNVSVTFLGLVVEKRGKVQALNLILDTFCKLIWCYRKRFPHQRGRPRQEITLRDGRLKELRENRQNIENISILDLPHTAEGYLEAKQILDMTLGKDIKVHKSIIEDLESLPNIKCQQNQRHS